MMGPDAALNHREISKFSKKDAEALPKYEAMLMRAADFLEPTLDEIPPDPWSYKLKDLWHLGKLGLRLAKLGKASQDVIEILTGALSGGVVARQPLYPKKGNCVFIMLLDPAAFGGAEHFQTEVAQLTEYIRDCPRIEGCERITLPGDPERFVMSERSAKGIFLDEENWAVLCRLASGLGVPVPGV